MANFFITLFCINVGSDVCFSILAGEADYLLYEIITDIFKHWFIMNYRTFCIFILIARGILLDILE